MCDPLAGVSMMSSLLAQSPSLTKEVWNFCSEESARSTWRTGGTTQFIRTINLQTRFVPFSLSHSHYLTRPGDSLVLENRALFWRWDETSTSAVCHGHIPGSHEWLFSEFTSKKSVFTAAVSKCNFFCRSCMDQTDHRSFASKSLEVKRAFQWLTPALTGLFTRNLKKTKWSKLLPGWTCLPILLIKPSSPNLFSLWKDHRDSMEWTSQTILYPAALFSVPFSTKKNSLDPLKSKSRLKMEIDYQKVKATNKPLAKVINGCSQNYHPQ